jgi:dienelactone hydrolase
VTKWQYQKFALALVVALVISACGQTPTQVSEIQTLDHPSCEDIVFYSDDEPVDAVLCLPAGPQVNLPAVVFLHGMGAFEPLPEIPDIEDAIHYNIHRELAEHGFVALSILYFSRTPSPPGALLNTFIDAPYEAVDEARPTWISTIEDGMSYMQSRPEVDPDRIALVGKSLGGSLALSLDQNRNDHAALILISGFVWEGDLENVSAGDIPILILHAEADEIVTWNTVLLIRGALNKNDIEHEVVVIEGADHRWLAQDGDKVLDAVVEFLESYLSPSGS